MMDGKRKETPMESNHRPNRFATISLLAMIAILVVGCGAPLEKQAFGQIEKGMSLEQVEGILGKGKTIPWKQVQKLIRNFPNLGISEQTCRHWVKWGNRSSYGLVGFQDGQVRELLSK